MYLKIPFFQCQFTRKIPKSLKTVDFIYIYIYIFYILFYRGDISYIIFTYIIVIFMCIYYIIFYTLFEFISIYKNIYYFVHQLE